MLETHQIQAASDLLFASWREGRRIEALPLDLRPESRVEGYAIQARLEDRSPAPLFGWKIAATSEAGQAHIGVNGPLAGRILAECVYEDGGRLPFGANHMRVAEIEFAFRMDRDLSPRAEPYSVEEVVAAVRSLHPAIEIPDSRYDNFTVAGAAQLIADNACAHLLVLGPATAADWRGLDLAAHPVTGAVRNAEGEKLAREGLGANVLGDPRLALTWLVNELATHDTTLKAGQVVTTGTCVIPLEIAPGDSILGDLGALGQVSARME